MSATLPNLPEVGPRRFFSITHNPKSETKPVRVEFRESLSKGSQLVSLSRILGFGNTIADEEQITATAALIVARVARVDEFTGIHTQEEK